MPSFAVIASERTIKGKTTLEHRFYISHLSADTARLNRAVRLHWWMDVAFGDDPMRARTNNAAHNFAVMRHFVLNLIRINPVKRNGGLKVRRLIASTSDSYRAEPLSCDCPASTATASRTQRQINRKPIKAKNEPSV